MDTGIQGLWCCGRVVALGLVTWASESSLRRPITGAPTDLGVGLRGLRYRGMLGSCKVKGQALEPESSGRQTEDGREVRKTITIHNSLFNKHVECLLWAQS